MNNNEIESAKSIYKLKKAEKIVFEEQQKELKKLETNPYVQKYLSLKGIVDLKSKNCEFEPEVMVQKSFQTVAANTKNSNKIYVYMGGEEFNLFVFDFYFNNTNPEYYCYRDLETMEYIRITLDECEKFEQQNKIIKFNSRNFEKQEDYEKEFIKLRTEFLGMLLQEPQEDVVKRFVMKKNQ